MIYLPSAEIDAAIRWLRLAQGPLRPDTVQPLRCTCERPRPRG